MDTENVLTWNDEEKEFYLKKMPLYSIYFLWLDDEIIYIGCTCNLKNRIRHHKSARNFTHYSVYKTSNDKFDASIIESTTIAFISHYTNHPLQNLRKHDYYPPKKIKV